MPRTETHFIWTEDYADRLATLYAAVEAAAKEQQQPLLQNEAHPYDTLKDEYLSLKAEAEAAGHRVVVRGLRDDEWDALVAAHPPREEGPAAEGDKALGIDESTGMRPMILAALVEPKLESRSRFDDWIVEMEISRGELNAIGMKAWRLTNGMGLVDPKLLPPLPTLAAAEN